MNGRQLLNLCAVFTTLGIAASASTPPQVQNLASHLHAAHAYHQVYHNSAHLAHPSEGARRQAVIHKQTAHNHAPDDAVRSRPQQSRYSPDQGHKLGVGSGTRPHKSRQQRHGDLHQKNIHMHPTNINPHDPNIHGRSANVHTDRQWAQVNARGDFSRVQRPIVQSYAAQHAPVLPPPVQAQVMPERYENVHRRDVQHDFVRHNTVRNARGNSQTQGHQSHVGRSKLDLLAAEPPDETIDAETPHGSVKKEESSTSEKGLFSPPPSARRLHVLNPYITEVLIEGETEGECEKYKCEPYLYFDTDKFIQDCLDTVPPHCRVKWMGPQFYVHDPQRTCWNWARENWAAATLYAPDPSWTFNCARLEWGYTTTCAKDPDVKMSVMQTESLFAHINNGNPPSDVFDPTLHCDPALDRDLTPRMLAIPPDADCGFYGQHKGYVQYFGDGTYLMVGQGDQRLYLILEKDPDQGCVLMPTSTISSWTCDITAYGRLGVSSTSTTSSTQALPRTRTSTTATTTDTTTESTTEFTTDSTTESITDSTATESSTRTSDSTTGEGDIPTETQGDEVLETQPPIVTTELVYTTTTFDLAEWFNPNSASLALSSCAAATALLFFTYL